MSHRFLAAIVVAALGTIAPSTHANTITVCLLGCDYASINSAIAAADDGDVIQLAAGTYLEGSVIDTNGKAITLRGAITQFGTPATILDGGWAHQVLQCISGETSETVFENLLIQNGVAISPAAGGGMYNQASSPTLTNCWFEGNASFDGGGMFNNQSSPILIRCTFRANYSPSNLGGGGMCNSNNSNPTLLDCKFVENESELMGGGMANHSESSPLLINCTFTNNSTRLWGGGMANWSSDSSPNLANCTFAGNFAGNRGHGMYNIGTNTMMTNCTFTGCCQVSPAGSFVDGGGNDYEWWCDDCRANVNCADDAVNTLDLEYLFSRWGSADPQCDLDGDGVVRASDLGLLFAAWGPCQ